MITESLMRQLCSMRPWRCCTEVPGWVTNGEAMVAAEADLATAAPFTKFGPLELLERAGHATEAIVELTDRRLPWDMGCEECGGRGGFSASECECPHCTGEHPCEECGGHGQATVGLRVYETKSGECIALAGRYGELLDGYELTVMPQCQGRAVVARLAGVVVAVVMEMRLP